MDESTERWLPVVGWEGLYEVSDQGRVRSLDRRLQRDAMGRVRSWRGRILKPSVVGVYPYVNLCNGPREFRKSRTVHSLVAEAFLGPRPKGMEVRHLNGNYWDPCVTNLAYGTHAENMADMRTHGTGVGSWTNCKNGHEYTPESTGHQARGRRCRVCKRISDARYYRRKRDGAA